MRNFLTSKNQSNLKYYFGFSLLEMLIALVVLSGGLLALASFQTQMLTQGSLSKEKSIGDYYAKQKMEQLRRLGFVNLPAIASTNQDTITDASTTFTRTWSIANGATSNVRLVKVLVSWVDRFNVAKSVELVSFISKFDQLDFASLSYPAGSSSSPIATIKDWVREQYWGKDVIVKYKNPQGVVKYYISNEAHQDSSTESAIDPPSSSNKWSEVVFVQGTLDWKPDSTGSHSVCELRFTDEVTAFGSKPNGTVDATATNPNAGARRCSPNMVSGIGNLQSTFACAVKVGESKTVYAGCNIEDGNGPHAGTFTTSAGAYSAAATGVQLAICQTSGTCASSATPTPTTTATATPSATATTTPTATPTATATPAATATPTVTTTPTATPVATATPSATIPATINISLTIANSNKQDSSYCTLSFTNSCAATSFSTAAQSGSTTRSYSATCLLTTPYTTLSATAVCTRNNSNQQSTTVTGITNGSTTTISFNPL